MFRFPQWSFKHFHPLSPTFTHFHPLSSTFTTFHPPSSTFNHFHPLSSTLVVLPHWMSSLQSPKSVFVFVFVFVFVYEITCGTSLVTKYPVAQSLLPTVKKKKKNKDKHLNNRMFSQKVYCTTNCHFIPNDVFKPHSTHVCADRNVFFTLSSFL